MTPSESLSAEELLLREAVFGDASPSAATIQSVMKDLVPAIEKPAPTREKPPVADKVAAVLKTLPASTQARQMLVHTVGEVADAPPPPREWLVEGLIPFGTVTFISGDGGIGKTLLGQQLMMAAALGLPWIGRPTVRTGSLALFCEDEVAEIQRRAVDIARHHRVSLSDPLLKGMGFLCEVGEDNGLNRFDGSAGDASPYGTTALYDALTDLAEKHKSRLVLLDSLHDVFTGNENYRPAVKAFVRALAQMARRLDAAVVVLAHPSMSGLDRGSGTSGSTAWNNAVRSRLYLTRREPGRGGAKDGAAGDARARVLKTMKANYGAIGTTIALRWEKGVFVAEEPPAVEGEVVPTRKKMPLRRVLPGPRW
ncbi:MAG TPA: AAA family ATPase [Candidatus Cybelea sp.]|nr:AAA family ATPase [Candidatus Cybelea sp.]